MQPEKVKEFATIVGMNQSVDLTIHPPETGIVATYDMTQCTAVAMLTESEEGHTKAYLQHYHPDSRDQGMYAFRQAIENHRPVETDISRVVLLGPAIIEGDVKRKRMIDEEFRIKLARICLDELGPKIDFRYFMYRATEYGDKYASGSLVIELGSTNVIAVDGQPILPKSFEK